MIPTRSPYVHRKEEEHEIKGYGSKPTAEKWDMANWAVESVKKETGLTVRPLRTIVVDARYRASAILAVEKLRDQSVVAARLRTPRLGAIGNRPLSQMQFLKMHFSGTTDSASRLTAGGCGMTLTIDAGHSLEWATSEAWSTCGCGLGALSPVEGRPSTPNNLRVPEAEVAMPFFRSSCWLVDIFAPEPFTMETAAESMIEFAWNAPKNTQSQSLINRVGNSYKYGKSEGKSEGSNGQFMLGYGVYVRNDTHESFRTFTVADYRHSQEPDDAAW